MMYENVLNLDVRFQPFGKSTVEHKSFKFPSNTEKHIKLNPDKLGDMSKRILVTCRTVDMYLFLCTDALRRAGYKEIDCFVPYVPYARQDRVMVSGEPFSIKVISDIINLQGYGKVYIYDPHSDVTPALINNSKVISNHLLVKKVLEGKSNYLIVSPDSGAYKKISKVAEYINYKEDIVTCNKKRNVSNGNIEGITCDVQDFEGKDLYIVDDICDGGGTFFLLSQELRKRNCGKINLIVSHGIFSKGVGYLLNVDKIYTTNSFDRGIEEDDTPKLKIYDINEDLIFEKMDIVGNLSEKEYFRRSL